MSASLHDPPATLEVEYDLHGIRCALRPRAERSFSLRVLLATASGLLALAASAGLVLGVVGYLGTGALVWLVASGFAVLAALVLFSVAVIDSAEQLDRYQARLGEGWLVLRFADQGSEIRIDLSQVTSCQVEVPDIRLLDRSGEEIRVPMGGHPREEILWFAAAVDLAVRDARQGDLPAPAELLRLLTPDERG